MVQDLSRQLQRADQRFGDVFFDEGEAGGQSIIVAPAERLGKSEGALGVQSEPRTVRLHQFNCLTVRAVFAALSLVKDPMGAEQQGLSQPPHKIRTLDLGGAEDVLARSPRNRNDQEGLRGIGLRAQEGPGSKPHLIGIWSTLYLRQLQRVESPGHGALQGRGIVEPGSKGTVRPGFDLVDELLLGFLAGYAILNER